MDKTWQSYSEYSLSTQFNFVEHEMLELMTHNSDQLIFFFLHKTFVGSHCKIPESALLLCIERGGGWDEGF